MASCLAGELIEAQKEIASHFHRGIDTQRWPVIAAHSPVVWRSKVPVPFSELDFRSFKSSGPIPSQSKSRAVNVNHTCSLVRYFVAILLIEFGDSNNTIRSESVLFRIGIEVLAPRSPIVFFPTVGNAFKVMFGNV